MRTVFTNKWTLRDIEWALWVFASLWFIIRFFRSNSLFLVFVRTCHFRSVLPTMQPSPRLESPFSHISHRIKELIGSESRDFKSETMRCGKFLKFKNLEHFLVSGNFSRIFLVFENLLIFQSPFDVDEGNRAASFHAAEQAEEPDVQTRWTCGGLQNGVDF